MLRRPKRLLLVFGFVLLSILSCQIRLAIHLTRSEQLQSSATTGTARGVPFSDHVKRSENNESSADSQIRGPSATGDVVGSSKHSSDPGHIFANITVSNRTLVFEYTVLPTGHNMTAEFVFGVASSACNIAQRNAIRDSWGKVSPGDSHRVVFVVSGRYDDAAYVKRKLEKSCDIAAARKEFFSRRDMIWIHAREHYREGLTRKTMAIIQFGYMFATNYVFKTDDDVYLDIPQMKRELLRVNQADMNGIVRPHIDYYGWYTGNLLPIRDPKSKHYLTQEDFSGDHFPPYATGVGYGLHRSFVECAVQHFPNMTHMVWEDVSTGFLAEQCGVSLVYSNNLTTWEHFRRDPKSWDARSWKGYREVGKRWYIAHGLMPKYHDYFHRGVPLPPPIRAKRTGLAAMKA